jgi:hypothetical protein
MILFVSVSLAICFTVGLILTSTLTYLEIRNQFRAKSHVCEYGYHWEKIAGIANGIISVGLGRAGETIGTMARRRNGPRVRERADVRGWQ